MKKMKLGKASRLLEERMEMINASEKVGIDVMMKLCQRVLDGKGMPEAWNTKCDGANLQGKRNVTNCSVYRGVKLVERGMKIVKRVLEKTIRALVIDDMQFGFMPGRGTRDALFVVR